MTEYERLLESHAKAISEIIREHYNSHTHVVISCNHADVLIDEMGFPTTEENELRKKDKA